MIFAKFKFPSIQDFINAIDDLVVEKNNLNKQTISGADCTIVRVHVYDILPVISPTGDVLNIGKISSCIHCDVLFGDSYGNFDAEVPEKFISYEVFPTSLANHDFVGHEDLYNQRMLVKKPN